MLQWLTQYIPESSLCINSWTQGIRNEHFASLFILQNICFLSLCIKSWTHLNTIRNEEETFFVIFAKYSFQRYEHQTPKLYHLWEKTKLKKLNHCVKKDRFLLTICLHCVTIIGQGRVQYITALYFCFLWLSEMLWSDRGHNNRSERS